MFGSRDEKWHGKIKRAFAPAFTMTAVSGLEKYVDETVDIFMDLTTERYGDGKTSVDLVEWIQFYAFDVLGQLLYGKRHGFLESGGDIGKIIEIVYMANLYALPVGEPFVIQLLAGSLTNGEEQVGQMPWLDRLLIKNPFFVWLQSIGLVDMTFSIVPFAKNHINERNTRGAVDAGDNSTADLLDRILALQRKDPEFTTNTEIIKLCAMLVFAGSDTTFVPPFP